MHGLLLWFHGADCHLQLQMCLLASEHKAQQFDHPAQEPIQSNIRVYLISSLTGTYILISSYISHWMFTAGGILKKLSREIFAVFSFRATCVLFKSWRDKLQLRSRFPWISQKIWYTHSFSAPIIKYRNKSLVPHQAAGSENNSVSSQRICPLVAINTEVRVLSAAQTPQSSAKTWRRTEEGRCSALPLQRVLLQDTTAGKMVLLVWATAGLLLPWGSWQPKGGLGRTRGAVPPHVARASHALFATWSW